MNRDEPLRAAAEVLLVTAPGLAWAAARWVDDDGWVDWDRLDAEWRDAATSKSGGEQRLIRTVAALNDCDPWGLDTANNEALLAALHVAATLIAQSAAACRAADAFLAGTPT